MMLPSLSPQEFVDKWRKAALTERSAAQQHFLDLCQLVGHEPPALADPTGQSFTFEAGASKSSGGEGWADVWKKGYFAWEYKGKRKNLDEAYQQLLQYRESLLNPPLLVVSDIDQIVIHTNFTNTVKKVVRLTLADLLTPAGMAQLRAVFYQPEFFRAPQTTEQATEDAAREFAYLADLLRKYGAHPQQAAHFLIRLLFCLFAEDTGLLGKGLFTDLVRNTRRQPAAFEAQLRVLFQAMAGGGWFGVTPVVRFDGKLFDDDYVLPLDSDGLDILMRACGLDWSHIEPSVLGTLFQRSLDPSKRSQIGAHYTSKEDILLIVEPVVMAPLRRRWAEVRGQAQELARQRDAAKPGKARDKRQEELERLLLGFAAELGRARILDPACGSANFLYVVLKLLLDLWKEVSVLAGELGLSRIQPLPGIAPSPAQLYGIEINEYAHELAQATIWIGYIQWLNDNGFGLPAEPILKPLDNIRHMDAILAYDEQGRPVEPEWPEADFVIGNPPFLGGTRLRGELGEQYAELLWGLYQGRVPRAADLVCYWYEKAREMLPGPRVGLLATQTIRIGANRAVLDRVKSTGDIFMAWSDRPWVLDGASVRVSMVGFDDGSEKCRLLNGKQVEEINCDLTSEVDLTVAKTLPENQNLAFIGDTKKGRFEISDGVARTMMAAPGNPNNRPNSDVIVPWINAYDVAQRCRNMWIIDFGVDMPLEEASQYERPFRYVEEHVKPARDKVRNPKERQYWWIHGRPSPSMRRAVSDLPRCIVTPETARHRLFVWISSRMNIAHKLYIFARSDDYFFGVLHSRMHEMWSLRKGGRLGVGNDPVYNLGRCFESFPFPWPPGEEPADAPRVQAIAEAARELVEKRDAWLNPEGATVQQLAKRTLTNLYNQRPTWLALAHRKLDEAVLDAYGWPHDLSDEETLERLLALNLERAVGNHS